MRKLHKHYSKKTTSINNGVQLNDEQVEIIEDLLMLVRELFGIYDLINAYNSLLL